MDFCLEKNNKNFQKEICALAKKFHEITKCNEEENCEFGEFIHEFDEIINNKKSEEFDFAKRAKFIEFLNKKREKGFGLLPTF